MSSRSIPPLDELLTSWRESLAEQRQLHSSQIATKLHKALTEHGPTTQQTTAGWLQEILRTEVWPLATSEMLPACSKWIGEQYKWPEDVVVEDLGPELCIAVSAVPVPTACPASTSLAYNPYSWVLPAVAGGLVGALLFGGQGSFIMSVAFVAGLGWLLTQPHVRARLGTVADPIETTNSSESSLPLFLAPLWKKMQVWIVRVAIRPYSDADKPSLTVSQLRELVDAYYNACADLVLMACWARATSRRPAIVPGKDDGKVPASLFESIGILQRAIDRASSDPDILLDAAEELVQAFTSEGYEWHSVERGTPFENSILTHFKTYGHIEDGQPMKMLSRALSKNGSVVSRGTIKRLSGDQ